MRGRWGQGSILTEKEIRRLDREVGVCEGGAHTRAEHTRAEHTRAARTTRACVRACVRACGWARYPLLRARSAPAHATSRF